MSIAEAFLKEQDLLWRSEPDSVLAKLRAELTLCNFPRRFLPLGFGIIGSAFRVKVEYGAAIKTLRKGMCFAKRLGATEEHGKLNRRLSYVWSHQGNYRRAVTENDEAIKRRLYYSVEGVGECLVDRGLFLGNLNNYEESNRAFFASLERTKTEIYQFSALQGISENYMRLGDLNSAIMFGNRAATLQTFPEAKARLFWTTGRVLSRQRKFHGAAESLTAAVEILVEVSSPTSLIDASLVTIDLCGSLLASGDFRQAHSVAEGMLTFVGPLRDSTPVAAAAAIDLAKFGSRRDGLTFAALTEARKEIRRAKTSSTRRGVLL